MLMKMLHYIRTLPLALGRPLSRAYIPELDGLRFLALILVMLWHASIRATRYSEGNGLSDGMYWYFPHGEVGVLLFFCISGYVVSQPFLNKPSSDWKVRAFYLRRFIRIYPPYFIALSACFFVLQIFGHVPQSASSYNSSNISLNYSYLASLFYMHGFIFDAPSRLNPPIWSLEIEIIFYAVIPVLMFFYMKISSRTTRIASIVAVISGLIVFTAVASSQFEIGESFRLGVLIHSYLFLLGVLAADISGDKLSRPRAKRLLLDVCFLIGLAGLLAIGLQMTQVDARLPGGWLTFMMEMAVIVSLTLLFIGAFYGKLSSQLLSLPWIRLIGTMCYSVYLTHIVAMQAASEILGKIFQIASPFLIWTVWLGVLIPAGLIVGLIFYICVERPFAAAAQGRVGVALNPSTS